MEILIAQAMKYILEKVSKNETVTKANKEVSEAVWSWIKPIFLKDDEPLNDLIAEPDDKDNQIEVETKVKKYIKKNPSKGKELVEILNLSSHKSISNINFISQSHQGSGDNIGGDKISGDKIIH